MEIQSDLDEQEDDDDDDSDEEGVRSEEDEEEMNPAHAHPIVMPGLADYGEEDEDDYGDEFGDDMYDEEIMNDLEKISEGQIKMDRDQKIKTLVNITTHPPKKNYRKSNHKRRNNHR